MGKLLEQGFSVGAGFIVDPAAAERTAEMRGIAVENGVEIILDSRAVELSTIGGLALPSVSSLPWASEVPHTPLTLTGSSGDRVAELIGEAAIEQKVTGVLAPTHLLEDVETWLDVDLELTKGLRRVLDANGSGTTSIYYPLVAPLALLRDETSMVRILHCLERLVSARAIDGVFIRVQGFGTTSAGPRNLRSYIGVARSLHGLGIPVVAERTGCVGVALAAFGAVGGVESSVTYGELYNARRLMKRRDGRGFVPPPRVYLPGAMLTTSVEEAQSILSRRGFRRLDCARSCCRSGKDAILRDPRRHFVVTRAAELAELSTVPSSERPEHYLTTTLRPARESSAQIARAISSYTKHRDRLDDWNLALQRTMDDDRASEPTVSSVPTGHRLPTGA